MNETVTDIKDIANGFAPIVPDKDVEEMFKAGVHIGHVKSKNHSAMQPYIFGVRNTVSIIDLAKTKEKLAEAATFIKDIAMREGIILFVGTRPSAKNQIQQCASSLGMPYYTDRWVGGTLTNYKVIAKRIEQMEEMEKERASGGFEKYTKKERLVKDAQIEKLKKKFDGLRTLKRLPHALFVIDPTHDETAMREAARMGIPSIALADTNANVRVINFPIPSSDDSVTAISYMMAQVKRAVEDGRKEATQKAESKQE